MKIGISLVGMTILTTSLFCTLEEQRNNLLPAYEATCRTFPKVGRRLKGIAIVSSQGEYHPMGIEIHGVEIPGGEARLKSFLTPYLNQKITQDLVNQLLNEILGYYREMGDLTSHITIPSQAIFDEAITIIVQKGKGDDVKRNNRYYDDQALSTYFTLQSGDKISREILLNDITWLNRNPFHDREALLGPMIQETVDCELRTKDHRSWRIYLGADNTGTEFTGNVRLYTGLNLGNAFGRGDLFTYQYTCDPTINLFQAHFGQYVAFLPWRHMVTAYGGYAVSQPDKGPGCQTEEQAGQASIRYIIPFKPMYTWLKQEFNVGANWKYTNSNTFFVEFPTPSTKSEVNVLDLMVVYSFAYEQLQNAVTFSLEGHGSPGTPLSHQNNLAYNALRRGAKAKYFYTNLTLGEEYEFKNKMVLAGLLRLQGTTAALLPMLQFGLGGYDSVRGYPERDYLADNALCTNFELRAPPFQPFRLRNHEVIFLAFLDYGLGHNLKPEETLASTEWLMSVGPGLRYRVNQHVGLRIDYGFRLHQLPATTHTLGKFHLGAQLTY